MTYEVEFRIPTAQYAYVNLKVTGEYERELSENLFALSDDFALELGRTGAALIGAVNHGHANPGAEPDATQLIKSELDGKILLETMTAEAPLAASQQEPEAVVHPATESLREVPSRPWNRQPEAVQQKPWDKDPAVNRVTNKPSNIGSLDDFFS